MSKFKERSEKAREREYRKIVRDQMKGKISLEGCRRKLRGQSEP